MKESSTTNGEAPKSFVQPIFKPQRLLKNWALRAFFLLLSLLLFFFPSANSSVRYAYRDVGSYYYPLFEQIQKSWEAGIPPLWNPYVNLGQPLAGDPTASIFYPGKLLFFLSSLGFLSFAFCFKLYLWLHTALAFYSASRLSRALGVSQVGATISGLSYAFSGQVLFQYTNVVYLIGAAWAPLHFVYALAFVHAKTLRRKISAVYNLSVVLALTILGGEPQIVYLSLLSLTILAIFFNRAQDCAKKRRFQVVTKKTSSTVFFLLGTVSFTFLLSAVQILPSLEIAEHSTRTHEEGVRSLWDVPEAVFKARRNPSEKDFLHPSLYRELLCQDFSSGGRSESIYRFSVGPWRWSEFIFPNIGGKQYPQNSRWFEIFPEELALWTPSLYFGVVPFALAVVAARFKRRSPSEYVNLVATWLALGGLLGALGGYGIGWFLHFIKDFTTSSPISHVFRNGDPLGGLYWFLTLLVPKFTAFRYPAKLMTLTAVGFSTLAGIGWDNEKFSRRLKFVVIAILSTALVGICVTLSLGEELCGKIQSPPNPLFGPFQAKLAVSTVFKSFVQTATVLFIFSSLLICLNKVNNQRAYRKMKDWVVTTILLVVVCDLYLANNWLVAVVPSKLFENKSSVVDDMTTNKNSPLIRIYRSPVWFPPFFQSNSSPRRLEERILWDVETFYPLYPCSKGIGILDVRGAFMEKEFARFIDQAAADSNLDSDLAFLDVQGILGPQFWTRRISPNSDNQDATEPPNWRVEFKKLNVPARHTALVRHGALIPASKEDHVEILMYSPNELAFLVTASEPSELIVADQYWSDWKVTRFQVNDNVAENLLKRQRNTQPLDETLALLKRSSKHTTSKVSSAFGFLRKTNVPEGNTCVVMQYFPRKLYLGGVISLLAWFALSLEKTRTIVRKRRNISR